MSASSKTAASAVAEEASETVSGAAVLAVNIYLYQPLMGVVILLAIILDAYKNRKL